MQIVQIVTRDQNGLAGHGRGSHGSRFGTAQRVGMGGIEGGQNLTIHLSHPQGIGQQAVHVGLRTRQFGINFMNGCHDGRIRFPDQLIDMRGIGTGPLETIGSHFIEGKGIRMIHDGRSNGQAGKGMTIFFQIRIVHVSQIQRGQGPIVLFRDTTAIAVARRRGQDGVADLDLDVFDLSNIVGNPGRGKIDIGQGGKGGLECQHIGLFQQIGSNHVVWFLLLVSRRHAPNGQGLDAIEEGILHGGGFTGFATHTLTGTSHMIGRLFALTTHHVGHKNMIACSVGSRSSGLSRKEAGGGGRRSNRRQVSCQRLVWWPLLPKKRTDDDSVRTEPRRNCWATTAHARRRPCAENGWRRNRVEDAAIMVVWRIARYGFVVPSRGCCCCWLKL